MSYTRRINNRFALADYSLDQQISSIAGALYHNIGRIRSSGLFNGRAGVTLLFAYLSKTFPGGEYEEITQQHLRQLREDILRKGMTHSLSTGKAGIGFVFQHLHNIGLIDAGDELDWAELDLAVSLGADRDHSIGNWDPMHGLVGLGLYFIERYKGTGEKRHLEKIVDHLESLAVVEKNCHVWTSRRSEQEETVAFNFGMAHGMPGLLSFLAQVYELGIRRPTIASLIASCMMFLLNNRASRDRLYSFPVAVGATNPESGKAKIQPSWRHGWCYGDLGMANALIHCGRALGQNEWRQKGVAIALRTTAIPFEYAGCEDAPFCHGTTGLVHQYNRLHQSTHNPRFKEAAEHWLKMTMDHYYQPGKFPGGYAYRCYDEDENRWISNTNFGLMEGITGIAFVFLSYLHDAEPGWDSIFQTNI